MGGDTTTSFTAFTSDDEEEENSAVEQERQKLFNLSSVIPTYFRASNGLDLLGDKPSADDSLVSEETGRTRLERWLSSSPDFEVNQRRRRAFRKLLDSYDELKIRSKSVDEAKGKILSYTPGSWLEKRAGLKVSDYNVPETTSIILIGPQGCGKSSLVNRITKVFEDDKSAPDRAQVTYISSASDGTHFLQEYMIPRHLNSFCLYDTCSLGDSSLDNINMLKQWLVNGVRHGEPVIRKSDSSKLKPRINCSARQIDYSYSAFRKVNFAIFVVDGLQVLKSLDNDGSAENQYIHLIRESFSCPYLSFKDDKPAIVVTHGDLLSPSDNACVRLYLGELLGVPPDKHIFDIPGEWQMISIFLFMSVIRFVPKIYCNPFA